MNFFRTLLSFALLATLCTSTIAMQPGAQKRSEPSWWSKLSTGAKVGTGVGAAAGLITIAVSTVALAKCVKRKIQQRRDERTALRINSMLGKHPVEFAVETGAGEQAEHPAALATGPVAPAAAPLA